MTTSIATQHGRRRVHDASVQWPKTTLRITFGVIWLIDAVLKWLPGFRSDYMATISGTVDGQPGWLKPWFRMWIDLQRPAPLFYADLVAVVETLIAVAVIIGFARKFTYIAAIVFSLLVWSTAEGFGGPYTSGSSDIGTAVIYALVFAALLVFMYYDDPARFSVDYWLDQRISWWHTIAEVGPRDSAISAPVAALTITLPEPFGGGAPALVSSTAAHVDSSESAADPSKLTAQAATGGGKHSRSRRPHSIAGRR